jgi:hypothetical protein
MDKSPLQAQAISEAIYGVEVKLHHMSHTRIPVTGSPTNVVFLTSKIKKKSIILKFTEVSPSIGDPGPRSMWQRDENNCLTCSVEDVIVHYQFAILGKVPPFYDQAIAAPRRIKVCMVDTVQELESNEMEIVYLPASSLPST